jgi:hypothetical protein
VWYSTRRYSDGASRNLPSNSAEAGRARSGPDPSSISKEAHSETASRRPSARSI